MNTTTHDDLPDLDDARVAAMERGVFARIGDERASRSARRRRWWIAGSAAAVVVVVAAVIAPAVAGSLNTATTYSAEGLLLPAVPIEGGADSAIGSAPAESAERGALMDGTRETILTGSATVQVDDVAAAADAISQVVERRGGYVESLSISASDSSRVAPDAISYPAPGGAGDGWISVRVPADDLTATIDSLKDVGDVTSSSASAQDVTTQAVDLRARISAAETSVARLTQLMAEAQTTADLIAAETALQERQAALDSDRQQLALLEGQVEMASLSVQLVPTAAPATADPAGFGDGVVAGWNGLVATLNAIVVAIGFLLPWLLVLGVAVLIVWAIVTGLRRARRRRTGRTTGGGEDVS